MANVKKYFANSISSQSRNRRLADDLSKDGEARIEATRLLLEGQTFTEPETSTERELKLKIRLRELDLELERLRNNTQRYCLLPDKTSASTIPGITSKAVLEDVKRVLNTSDNEKAIRAIYGAGFGSRSGAWIKVEVKKWLFGIPNNQYHILINRLREKVVDDPFGN